MNKINCSFKGCAASIETTEPVASVVKYTCRQHVGKNPAKEPHFQDSQFDPRISGGTDPKAYESGRSAFGSRKDFHRDKSNDGNRGGSNAPRKFVERIIKKAGPELQNHTNRTEIVEILKEDVRDANVGVAKSGDFGGLGDASE